MLISFPLRSVSLGLFVYSLYTLRALFFVLPLFVEYTSFYLSKKKRERSFVYMDVTFFENKSYCIKNFL